MPTFEVDDQFHGHPKAAQAGFAAIGLWTCLGSWCMAYLTDGVVPRGLPLVVHNMSLVQSLLQVGMLEEKDADSYQIHDFLHWNKPAVWFYAQRAKACVKKRDQRAKARVMSKCPQGTQSGTPHGSPPGESPPLSPVSPSPSVLTDPTDLVPADAVPPVAQKESEPDSPQPPPVLTPPEPKPPKRKPKQQPLVVKVASGVGWKLWRSLYPQSKRNYGCYVDAPEDGREMARIVNSATDHAIAELRDRGTPGDPVEPIVQAILDYWFKEYLRDDGGERGWLVEQRHPLRYVLKGITKYGTPWSKSRPGGSTGLPQEALNAREALHKAAEVRCGT